MSSCISYTAEGAEAADFPEDHAHGYRSLVQGQPAISQHPFTSSFSTAQPYAIFDPEGALYTSSYRAQQDAPYGQANQVVLSELSPSTNEFQHNTQANMWEVLKESYPYHLQTYVLSRMHALSKSTIAFTLVNLGGCLARLFAGGSGTSINLVPANRVNYLARLPS